MSRPERGPGRIVDPAEYGRERAAWQATLSANPWAGWQALLRGEKIPTAIDEPLTGYYRDKNRDGTYVAVAYWYDGDQLFCHVQGKGVIPDLEARERWNHCAHRPISQAVYEQVVEQGLPWPDMDEKLANFIGKKSHDFSLDKDSPEAVAEQIEAARGSLADYFEILSDDQLAQSQSVRARLLELSGIADKTRSRLKQPYLDGQRAVDSAWMPLVKLAKSGADTIRAAQEAYQTKKRNAQLEAERIRLAVAARAAETPSAGNEPPPEVNLTGGLGMDDVPGTIRGGYGRGAATIFVDEVTGLTDPNALWEFLRGPEDPAGSKCYPKLHPELRDCMLKLAQRAVAAKLLPPGVTVEQKARVR